LDFLAIILESETLESRSRALKTGCMA